METIASAAASASGPGLSECEVKGNPDGAGVLGGHQATDPHGDKHRQPGARQRDHGRRDQHRRHDGARGVAEGEQRAELTSLRAHQAAKAERDQEQPHEGEHPSHHGREDREAVDVGVREAQAELFGAWDDLRSRQAADEALSVRAPAASRQVDREVVDPVAGSGQPLQLGELHEDDRERSLLRQQVVRIRGGEQILRTANEPADPHADQLAEDAQL